MSSALDALLEAARYIELQEQNGFRDGWIPPPFNSTSSSDLHFNTNILRSTNNTDNHNSINNHHITNNTISNHRHNNHHLPNHVNDYNERNSIRRNENFQPQNHRNNNSNHINNNTTNNNNMNSNNNNNNINSNNNNNNSNSNSNGNGNGNIINNRILSPTSSPTSQNNLLKQQQQQQQQPISGINLKTYNINTNSHSTQNELISNSKTLIEERIENGVNSINNNNNNNIINNNNIEIITNGRHRHNSGSSPIKGGGINFNNMNNINNNNNNNNNNSIISTTLNSTTSLNSTTNNNSTHAIMSTTTEDSSQSSLNLSSSSYLSGSPNNNHNSSSSSILNSDNLLPFQLTSASAMITTAASSTGSGRRRTISNTSDGSQSHRNSSTVRPGTREIHNKLEKHRRAHLKECFEQLKVQLQLKDEEKKKTSNLAILGAAYRHVMALRRKERELEQQVELLAKEKINAQKKIVSLKRELVAKYDNIDFSSIVSDANVNNGITIANSTNSICNTNNSSQQHHHQIVPLNLNRTSSPQTLLLSPNNSNNIKINHNNDVIMSHITSTKEVISIENNKNIISSGRKIHHQYSTDKPKDLTINSPHKVVIQSNNSFNNINNNIQNLITNSTTPTTTTTTSLNIKEDPDHPTQKVIKQYNLIALAPVDKDNKIISSTSLPIPQVVTAGGVVIPMLSSQALRVIGPNNLSTIEFSTPSLQNHLQNSIPSLASVTSGQQLQKLFINSDCTGTTTISAHPALAAAAAAAASAASGNDNKNGITTTEINRLPGGAELNILPASVTGTTTLYRGNEKLTFVNNAITLKNSSISNGATSVTTSHNNSSRAVHVVTSNHQNTAGAVAGLTPIVVTQGQQINNLTQLIATTPQLGKMNISVTGHHHQSNGDIPTTLLNATQFIHTTGPMKQMVVAVANNATPTNTTTIQTSSTINDTIGKI